ncbi:MAG: glycosyltransferase family 4 protein [Nanoarchaeota archaeon]
MKILYSNKSLYPYEGGADISAFTLLEHLAEKHEVSAYYIGDIKENSKVKLYPQKIKQKKGLWINLFFLRRKWKKILKKAIEKEKPDLIISQDYFIGPSVKIAKKYGVKSIIFLRSYFHLSIDNFKSYLPEEGKFTSKDLIYQLQWPFFKFVVKESKWALKNADLVCSVSNYMRDVTLKFCNVKSEVVRPFVSFNECKAERKGDYILYINPDKHKGKEIFEKIATLLPLKKFLVAGKKDYKTELMNVDVVGFEDKKEIYSKGRLLLVPSIFPDPHPRVVVEAMVNGIPCVVSDRGGLREEVGGAGVIVEDIFDIDEWVKKIKAFDDEEFYKKMSKYSQFKALEFEDKRQFIRFEHLLSKLFN